MNYETLLYGVSEHVATITLNRPERLNAISRQLIEELGQAMSAAESDTGVRCVLLTGAGRGFCAGADLGDPSRGETATRDAGAALDKFYNPTIRRMRAMPKPIVAAVNGVAAGAGMSLALASDITIAARSASFLQAFARIGLLPDAGSTWLLPRLVGDQRARALAMLAPQIPAEQAQAWGMIWQVVDDDKLMQEAGGLAKRLAAGPTLALARIKQALMASTGNTLSAQLDLERDLQRELGRSADFAEGVAAFLQKRPAKFEGK